MHVLEMTSKVVMNYISSLRLYTATRNHGHIMCTCVVYSTIRTNADIIQIHPLEFRQAAFLKC